MFRLRTLISYGFFWLAGGLSSTVWAGESEHPKAESGETGRPCVAPFLSLAHSRDEGAWHSRRVAAAAYGEILHDWQYPLDHARAECRRRGGLLVSDSRLADWLTLEFSGAEGSKIGTLVFDSDFTWDLEAAQ